MAEEVTAAEVIADQPAAPESVFDQPESFLEVDAKGEKLSFKTKDELANWVKSSAMMDRDYRQKTQSLAEQRKQHEKAAKDFEEQKKKELESIEKAQQRWNRYEDAFKKRPHVLQAIERMIDQPASPDEMFDRTKSYADERLSEYEKRLQAVEEERERERLEAKRNEVYMSMKEKYSDFDPDAISQALEQIQPDDLSGLVEMIYKATRYKPGEIEEKVAESFRKKQGAKIAPGGGGPPPPTSGTTDTRVAKEQAYRDAGLL